MQEALRCRVAAKRKRGKVLWQGACVESVWLGLGGQSGACSNRAAIRNVTVVTDTDALGSTVPGAQFHCIRPAILALAGSSNTR